MSTVPTDWVVRVMEAAMRVRDVRSPWDPLAPARAILHEMIVIQPPPIGVLHHDYIFFRVRQTETTTCQVCGHTIVGTFQLRTKKHLELHISQVRYVMGQKTAPPRWEHTDGP